jgi:hypothetical protein
MASFKDSLKTRLKAASIHFCISLVIAALAALLVFGVWYPYPYREISGGRELFLIVVSVDVILGPLITMTIFSDKKSWKVLKWDLAFIGVVQLAALGYGLWTVFIARPVHLVFEYDRFRVVHAVDIPMNLMHRAPPELQTLPLNGPTLLSLRAFKDESEKVDDTLAALNGVSLSSRPDLWRAYEPARADILKLAKPIAQLKTRFPAAATQIEQVAASTGRAATLVTAPMIGRNSAWTVFLDPVSAQPLAFMPLDSF